jgi:hypothetical protein
VALNQETAEVTAGLSWRAAPLKNTRLTADDRREVAQAALPRWIC